MKPQTLASMWELEKHPAIRNVFYPGGEKFDLENLRKICYIKHRNRETKEAVYPPIKTS